MDLLALRTIVRDTTRRGNLPDSEAIASLPREDGAALRAWRRRLQSVGGNAISLVPSTVAYEWLAAPQPEVAG